MILGLNYKDGNYFGKAIKIKGIWYIWLFNAYDETYTRIKQTRNIEKYIKENNLIKY